MVVCPRCKKETGDGNYCGMCGSSLNKPSQETLARTKLAFESISEVLFPITRHFLKKHKIEFEDMIYYINHGISKNSS